MGESLCDPQTFVLLLSLIGASPQKRTLRYAMGSWSVMVRPIASGTRMKYLAALSMLAVSFSPVGAAQPDMQSMIAMKGRCSVLRIGTVDASAKCLEALVNTVNRNGRVSFYFSTSDGAVVTFSGQGKQVKPDPNTAVQPIDEVIFGFKGATNEPANAVGFCRYTNPYKDVATIACTAQTDRGTYQAEFTSDGKPPRDLLK